MNPFSTLTWRIWLTPLAALAAILALLGTTALSGDDPDVDTIADVADPDPERPQPATTTSTTEEQRVETSLTLPSPEVTVTAIETSSTTPPLPTTAPVTTATTAPDTTATTRPPTTATTRPPTTATSAPATTATTRPAPVACPDPWSNLAGCGWPGPGNTGPRTSRCPGGLTDRGGSTTGEVVVSEPGAVISCQRIRGHVVIRAADVTVRDSVVTFDGGGGNGGGAIVIDDGGSATIEHVEVNGLDHTHACVWHQGEWATVAGIDCHGTTDGAVAWARVAYSPTSGDNMTVRDSWFHDFTPNASNGHMDGFQTAGTTNVTVRHNTFLMPLAANSAVAVYNSVKDAHDITVSQNLMAGANFTVYAMDQHPSSSSPAGGNSVYDVTFSDNVFSTHLAACVGVWGAWYDDNSPYHGGPTDGWHRSGNHILETGRNIDGGNPDCR